MPRLRTPGHHGPPPPVPRTPGRRANPANPARVEFRGRLLLPLFRLDNENRGLQFLAGKGPLRYYLPFLLGHARENGKDGLAHRRGGV
jgi:hypothetical protein